MALVKKIIDKLIYQFPENLRVLKASKEISSLKNIDTEKILENLIIDGAS